MAIETVGLVLFGLGVLTAGAELLVRGASRLATAVGISPLVIGLTVVAYGTSAPEMAVSAKASLAHQPDIALGNVLGSNIFNVLFILGVSALIRSLAVDRQLVRLDVPIMIGVSALVWLMALDGQISRAEGLLLCAGIVLYNAFLIRLSRRKSVAPQGAEGAGDGPRSALRRKGAALALAFVLVGLGLLTVGARWLVRGAVGLAAALGVSELVIAVTVVAAGTSLPELATSVVATIHRQRDIAVGNIVGSNIFNALAVLGVAGVVSPAGLSVAPGALRLEMPVMLAAAAACLPVFFTGGRIARWEGFVFLAYYLAYLACLISQPLYPGSFGAVRTAVLWVITPLMLVVVLAPLVPRRVSSRRARPGKTGRGTRRRERA